MLLAEWEGVEIGMWTDDVLALHPNTEWIKPATIFIDEESSKEVGFACLIATWHYKEVDIVLEVAKVETLTGTIRPYAVQKIISVEDGGEDDHKTD